MNITETKRVMPTLIKHKIVPLLWGSQGVGKTSVVKQVAKETGFESVVHLQLASQEVGDLVGVLLEQPNGTAKHTRPDWFPESGKHLIFLDEFNRAHPDVLQAMFTFILEGKIHQHVLPPNCAIVAAANYQNSKFNVTDTSDSALMSRFCHIDFKPTKEEFIVYAETLGAESVADFIRDYPQMLETDSKDKFDFNTITPDRRAWLDFISKLETESTIEGERYEVYSGLVGSTAAAAFMTWKNEDRDKLSGKLILSSYDKVQERVKSLSNRTEIRFDLLNSAADEIYVLIEKKKTLKPKELNNFKQFMLDVPLEFGLKIINKLDSTTFKWSQKKEILNNKEFVTLFRDKKLVEKNNKT